MKVYSFIAKNLDDSIAQADIRHTKPLGIQCLIGKLVRSKNSRRPEQFGLTRRRERVNEERTNNTTICWTSVNGSENIFNPGSEKIPAKKAILKS